MKYQGIAISLTKNKAIVTTDDFQCFYIKRAPTIYVGKEVEFTDEDIIKKRLTLTKLIMVAACVAILFGIVSISNLVGINGRNGILSDQKVFAYVDVDINPSLEIGIDSKGNVLRLVPLNEDAKIIIDKNRSKLDKVNVFQAIDVIMGESNKNKDVSEAQKKYILISGALNSKKNESDKAYQVERQKLDSLLNSLKNDIQYKENDKVNVFLVQADIDERKDARREGMSTGRYVLYKNLKGGYSIEEAKRVSINGLIEHVLNGKTDENFTGISTPISSNAENNAQKGVVTLTDNSNNKTPGSSTSNNNYTKEPDIKLNTPLPSSQSLAPTTPSLMPTPTIHAVNPMFSRFESYNYKGYYIRHASFKGYISSYVTPEDDSVFKVVAGLADPTCISFESKNFPGHYLKHENFKVILKKDDGSTAFKEDATFRRVAGIADNNLFSFESFNYPKRYIRHASFNLHLDEIISDLDKKDATFSEIKVE